MFNNSFMYNFVQTSSYRTAASSATSSSLPTAYSFLTTLFSLTINIYSFLAVVKRDEGKDCDQDPSSKKSENKWDIMKSNILPNKEANVIKSKLARLIKKYKSIKKHNKLIIKLVKIKRTGIGNFYADQLIPAGIKDLFNSANRETVMATAIAEMGQKLKKEQLEVEKERWVYKRERSRIEFELRIKELDLKF
uniref:Uncharacterized protein n=1 Tax=Rhizophagus irregularis (strain DAOM 181602 / DAOM 197198 / MUCL 43194) TaxID=747089 RepID=U9UWK3_RHIID